MWCNADKKWSEEINIEEWGWKLSKKAIEPIWATLAEASQACKELIKCNCRTNFLGNGFTKKKKKNILHIPFVVYYLF